MRFARRSRARPVVVEGDPDLEAVAPALVPVAVMSGSAVLLLALSILAATPIVARRGRARA